MKAIIILSACIIVCAAEYYVIRKDDYTAESLRSDKTELKKRLDCFIDAGPCSPMGEAYKSIADDLVTTKCAKCSPELLQLSRAFLETTMEEFPTEYEQLRIKYDPARSYFDDLEKAVGCRKHFKQSLQKKNY